MQSANLVAARAGLEQETLKRTALEKDLASTRDQLDELRTSSSSERKKLQQQCDILRGERETSEKVCAGWPLFTPQESL